MFECTESFEKAMLFSTLNTNSMYWKFKMGRKDVDKTALLAPNGLWKYTRMPSRLNTPPAKFQKAMNVIGATVKRQHAPVYIDDIIIFSKHWKNTRDV